jgi:ferritin-like metal-binding protein YciE
VREHIEDSSGQIHDAETVLEALVRRRRVDKPGESELVNVTEPLKGA